MSRRGLSLLEMLVAIAIVATLVGLLLPAVQKLRAAASRSACTNNLHQIALALHQHHDAHDKLPPATTTKPGQPFLPYISWSARVLPHLEQDAAWGDALADYGNQLSFSKPMPHRNLARPMSIFICPADGRKIGTNPDGTTAAFTHYLGVAGTKWMFWDGVLYPNSTVRFADITDGASQTLMLGERPPSPDNSFGWWYAGAGQGMEGELDSHIVSQSFNRTFRAPTCPKDFIYGFSPGDAEDMCSTFHFWSRHSGGANFALVDGSVRFLPYSAAGLVPALSTRAGHEVASIPE